MEEIMKQKKQFSSIKQKSYLTAGVITLTAVIAMAGIYYKDKKKDAQAEAIVMAETEKQTEQNSTDERETDLQENQTAESETTQSNQEETKPETVTEETQQTSEAQTDEKDEPEAEKEKEVKTIAAAEPKLHFSKSDSLAWPVNGDVVLNYSMDQSVYFATLDQYKYNPAVIIHGEVNDKVEAASDGQVISVDTNAETGLTVTVGMGDGYQAVYGQLKEVDLSAGDYISRGDTIGFINEPTKYYSVEGSNLYFAMTKDGEPVNPLDYFE